MSAAEIIEQIKRLPEEEREIVRSYARERLEPGQLPGRELQGIAQKMLDAKDPAEAKRYEDEFVRGFYGDAPHA
jgi:hypothetical protein